MIEGPRWKGIGVELEKMRVQIKDGGKRYI